MSELGARAVLAGSGSRVVTELERAGLGRPGGEPRQRSIMVRGGHADGRVRLRAAAPVYLAGIQEHFGHLSEAEVRAVTRALGRVVAAEEWSPNCAGPQSR